VAGRKKPRPLLPSAGHAHEKTKGSMLKDIKELEASYIANVVLTIPLCGKFLFAITWLNPYDLKLFCHRLHR
jgi:hypothetical protein